MDGDHVTVSDTFETEITVKGSRFIGIVQRCPDADSVKDALADISARYPNATHYCYAAVYGGNSRIERFSDNGEPPGTAGRPIMSVLRGSGLTDTVCVVVRYFGGTLLGTGGLVQTYTECASLAVNGCRRTEMVFCRRYGIDLDYGMYDRFLSGTRGLTVGEPQCEYTDRVYVRAGVRERDVPDFEKRITDLFGGKVAPRDLGSAYSERVISR